MNSITSHNLRRLGDGDAPSASDWNMLVSRLHSQQDETLISTGDVLRLTENADPILARINSGASPSSGRRAYGWNFVNREASGANRDTLHFGGGTTITSPAYESSGRSDVPVDGTAIVWLRPGAGDYYEFTYADRPVWAKLTSSSGANYAWTEVYPSATSATFSALSGGMSGTTSVNPAVERNGIAGIPADTIVRIERGYASGAPQVAINRTQLGNGLDAAEIYSIAILNATSGTFTITFEGQTTSALAYDIDAATLETALESLSTITDCEVSGAGTANDPFLVELADDLDEHEIFEATSSLKGDQEWLFTSPIANASYDPVDGGTISTSQNNYQLTGVVTFFDIDTTVNFTGFVAPTNGKADVVYVKNVGSKVATFVHESGSSTAANRFHCPTQSDYQLPPQSIGVFKYDTIGLRWQPVLNIPTYAAYTKTQITNNQDDYALSEYSHIYRLSTDQTWEISGFANGFPGRLLIVENVGSFRLVLANQSVNSTAANRIITSTGANLILEAGQSVIVFYDGIDSRWRVVTTPPVFSIGTSGTDINWGGGSSGYANVLNVPSASDSARGVVTTTSQNFGGGKRFVNGCVLGTYSGSMGFPFNLFLTNGTTYSDPYTCGIGFDDESSGDFEIFLGYAVGELSFTSWAVFKYDKSENLFDFQGDSDPSLAINGTPGGTATVSGLTFKGGLYISGSVSASITIGNPVSGGTSKYILFVDGSGNLAQSADFQWDDTAKSLTLGNQGYLVTTKTSAPSGIPTNSIAGPFITS